MKAEERDQQREGILSDLAGLLREAFALEAWGRLLVFVERASDGAIQVNDIQVEEILDEPAVERAFESADARAALSALASAVEALTVLDDLDLADLSGGTFVRNGSGVAWLAGCVRTPSATFDARRDGAVERVAQKNRVLGDRFEIGGQARIEADMVLGTARALVGDVCRAFGNQVVLGSFSKKKRSWVWGAHNPTLASEARRRASDAIDSIRDRSMWEVSTPGFVTDEATAWALAALVADERGLAGIVRIETHDGFVLLGLSDLTAPD